MEEVLTQRFVAMFTTKELGDVHIRTLSSQKSGLKSSLTLNGWKKKK